MSLLSQTKEICQCLGIRPKKRFGQNFLIEQNALNKIIRLAEVQPSDLILEIGAGFGFLTQALAQQASFVITVESDRKIIGYLEKELSPLPNVELVKGDILEQKIQEKLVKLFSGKEYKVVANIPYQITSALLRFFLTNVPPPRQMILMIQKEVAQRLIARPPRMNLLALSVNFYAQMEILSFISRNNFWPRPKVDSALIKLKVKSEKLKVENDEELFRIIKIGFSGKRKKLISNLSGGLKIDKKELARIFFQLGWQENLRAENLALNDWLELLKRIKITKKSAIN